MIKKLKKPPTYLLDEKYYSLVDKLSVEIEKIMNGSLRNILTNFKNYLIVNAVEKLRTDAEYGLELLYMGVLYISYPHSYEKEGTLYKQFTCLFNWLEGTKEYKELVVRFRLYSEYWNTSGTLPTDFPIIIKLASDFIDRCIRDLSQYTVQVPDFISRARYSYINRDDLLLVTRHINEYYMNMVGAQILNHIYEKEFKQADNIYVFVPGCMAAQMNECKAKAGDKGFICIGCTDTCPINLTRQLSESYHAKTVIVYHNSELYKTKVDNNGKKYGVIGIACVLNLIAGGLKARELGYAPQCVLLDYCGCKHHWDSEGLVTDINRNRLQQILSS